MWQQEKKDNSILNFALLLALATTTPMAVALLVSLPVLATISVANTSSPHLPQVVEQGTIIRVDGSTNLMKINQGLKEDFEQHFSGAQVEIGNNGTDAALKALQDGKIDIAAITRKLTPEEKAGGLAQVILFREKIAVIVGVNNPFHGSLTTVQLAQIFTGEIENWSKLGCRPLQIRVIEHPITSDIRQAFHNSTIFKTSLKNSFPDKVLATSSNITEVPMDNVGEIIQKLDSNVISYALANQVSQAQTVRVLQVSFPRSSQSKANLSMPLVYVYKKKHSQGVSSFLSFVNTSSGKQAIDTARKAESSEAAISALQSFTVSTSNKSSNTLSDTTNSATKLPITNAVNASRSSITPRNTSSHFYPNNYRNDEQQFMQPLQSYSSLDKNLIFMLSVPLLLITGLGATLALKVISNKKQLVKQEEADDLQASDVNDINDINNNDDSFVNNEASVVDQTSEGDNSKLFSPANNLSLSSLVSPDHSDIGDEDLETYLQSEDSLNSPEVEWDIEAPVAVVRNPYHQILNISELTYEGDLTNSLLEPPEITAAASINSPTSLAELLGVPPAVVPIDTSPTSLSELLGIPKWSPIDNSDSTKLELLDVLHVDVPAASNGNHSGLSELLDLSTVSNDSFHSGLSELLDIPAIPDDSSSFYLLDLLNSSEAKIVDCPPSGLSELPDILDLSDKEPISDATAAEITDPLDDLLDLPSIEEPISDATATEITDPLDDLLDLPSVEEPISDATATEITDPLDDLLDLPSVEEPISDATATEITDPLDDLLDLPSVEEPISDVTEINNSLSQVSSDLEEISSSFDLRIESNVSSQVESDIWVSAFEEIPLTETEDIKALFGTEIIQDNFPSVATEEEIEEIEEIEQEIIQIDDFPIVDSDSSIVLTPRTPKWAYVSWYVSEANQKIIQSKKNVSLAVRLYDVTHIDLSYQIPDLVQQYECEEGTHDRYVAIPINNRDYIAEIGYFTKGHWFCIARSTLVRIFSHPRTDFLFATDTELVIYGAVEPGSRVTIDGKSIELKSDGTFQLNVPFIDHQVNYLIKATSSDGEQTKTISKKFAQETS
jgi:phosphate transport system substrate-binding protein